MRKNYFSLKGSGTAGSELAERLLRTQSRRDGGAETNGKRRYRVVEGRNGAFSEKIPAFIDKNGNSHVLHSLVSPKREAEKLIDSAAAGGGSLVLVILGLGGGWLARAALEKNFIRKVIVIDYNIAGIRELLENNDYAALFRDSRFALLVDESPAYIEDYIAGVYLPALYNGIAVLPLRARTDFDSESFAPAYAAIQAALDRAASDFSTQARFGKRWFSNIISNIAYLENQHGIAPPVTNAAVCAAGPLLDVQLDELRARRNTLDSKLYVIATDTSLGSLVQAKIKIDAIVSIDCQHTSLEHFTAYDISDIPLFLDLLSPPRLSSLSRKCTFFAGGHPLGKFISIFFKELAFVDTSGANVTYAAVSLAEQLGAKNIYVYGADFAYPEANLYSRGAYFYPVLRRRENRFAPVSAQIFDFLFRNKTLKYIKRGRSFYYQTGTLNMYKQRLEEKIKHSAVNIVHITNGTMYNTTINVREGYAPPRQSNVIKLFSSGKPKASVNEFLNFYKKQIEQLPDFKPARKSQFPETPPDIFMENLSELERQVFITLLPTAASFKRRRPGVSNRELFEEVKAFCVGKIDSVMGVRGPAPGGALRGGAP